MNTVDANIPSLITRSIKTAARMARADDLDGLYSIAEKQKSVKTSVLMTLIDNLRDSLGGYASEFRNTIDQLHYSEIKSENWKDATAEAPKTGEVFIGMFKSYPIPTIASWNGCENKWVIASHQINDGDNGDFYFESEWLDFDDLHKWKDLEFDSDRTASSS